MQNVSHAAHCFFIQHGFLNFHAEISIWQGMPFASTFRDQHLVV
jgi:hypothetical protein